MSKKEKKVGWSMEKESDDRFRKMCLRFGGNYNRQNIGKADSDSEVKKLESKKVRQNQNFIGLESLNEKLETLFTTHHGYTGFTIDGIIKYADGEYAVMVSFYHLMDGREEYICELSS